MDSIKIGGLSIAINDDPTRVIVFDPTDVVFVKKYYNLTYEINAKQQEFETRAKDLDKVTETDANGMPTNASDRIALLEEMVTWCQEKIDQLFGAGTSKKAFGESKSMEQIGQFFEGMNPFFERERNKKLAKYINEKSSVLK